MDDHKNDIDKYIKGELTPAQMHALEKKALSDPFLADALEGLGSLPPEEFSGDMKDLQARLNAKAHKNNKVWMWTGRIAAGLLILAISTFLVMVITDSRVEKSENLALNKEKESTPVPHSEPLPQRSDTTKPEDVVAPQAEPRMDEAPEPAQQVKPSGEASPPPQTLADRQAEEPVAAIEDESKEDLQELEISEALREEQKIANAVPSKKGLTDSAHPATTFELDKSQAADADDEAALAKRRASGSAAAREQSSSYTVSRKIVRGKVTFSEDGTGLPGVNVLIKGSNEGTVTDSQGNYQIPVEGQPTLQFSFIGFSTKELDATSNELDVQLDTDVSELSEVVVVGLYDDPGFPPSTPSVMELATPEGGRKVFKQYLEQNLLYPEEALKNQVEGKVTVQFTIGLTGQLSDFRVIRGLGFGCEEEVIRLIKQGPKWSPTKKNEAPIKDRARVRMRFSLPKK
jgi:TonB family protein